MLISQYNEVAEAPPHAKVVELPVEHLPGHAAEKVVVLVALREAARKHVYVFTLAISFDNVPVSPVEQEPPYSKAEHALSNVGDEVHVLIAGDRQLAVNGKHHKKRK